MPHSIHEKESEYYYHEGLRFNVLKMIGPAIKAFEKDILCEKTESYKAYYELAKIYMKLKDFDAAYECCAEAIKVKPQYMQALYYMVHILKMLKISQEELRKRMEGYTYRRPLDYILIADIFYMEGYYETTLEYISKYEREKEGADNIKLLKVKCLIRSARYGECIEYINTISEENLYYFKSMMYKILCLVVINKYDLIWKTISKFNYGRLNGYNKKVLSVYMEFYNVMIGNKTSVLCEDEKDREYTSCIFEICDILLMNKESGCFEKTLNLLNLISDKTVLLQLAKLYNKYGYIELAKKEIIRSIKLFEVFDGEGLDILTYTI